MVALFRFMVQVQLQRARQIYWTHNDELSSRVYLYQFSESIAVDLPDERRMMIQEMTRMLADRRPLPTVQYVDISARRRDTGPLPGSVKLPKEMLVFYTLGLIFSLVFAALLAFSAVGKNLIHPFLALLGFVGGLGWLTTAWTDLLLTKRERLAKQTSPRKDQDREATEIAAK